MPAGAGRVGKVSVPLDSVLAFSPPANPQRPAVRDGGPLGAGYWAEEWCGVNGVMIWVTGDKINLDREPPDHCPDAW
jgi:hypothetical protein